MGRIKDYKTKTISVKAIQFVRGAITDILEFVGLKDCQFTFTNNGTKFSGIVTNVDGKKLMVNGKDYLVKDEYDSLSVYNPTDFANNFEEVTE